MIPGVQNYSNLYKTIRRVAQESFIKKQQTKTPRN